MRGLRGLAVFAMLAVLAPSAPASAHVRVFPSEDATAVAACGFTKFVVRVPTEKPIPTTAVRVEIPRGVTVIAVQPKPGWHADFTFDRGAIATVTWTGGKILPREFEEFAFLAAGPKTATSVDWDALQTYEDGTTVRWNGPPGSDTPATHTTFTAPSGSCGSRSR